MRLPKKRQQQQHAANKLVISRNKPPQKMLQSTIGSICNSTNPEIVHPCTTIDIPEWVNQLSMSSNSPHEKKSRDDDDAPPGWMLTPETHLSGNQSEAVNDRQLRRQPIRGCKWPAVATATNQRLSMTGSCTFTKLRGERRAHRNCVLSADERDERRLESLAETLVESLF